MIMGNVPKVDEAKCTRCGLCKEIVDCPGSDGCIGCLACYWACPHGARSIAEERVPGKEIAIRVDGKEFKVQGGITIKKALGAIGFSFGIFSTEGDLQAPCCTGGCYSCMVVADGEPIRSCVSGVREGMEISTQLPRGFQPRRVVHGPQPHGVGGKATPWWLKAGGGYIEVAIWVGGCNLRCPQCQNYQMTYDGKTTPTTPQEAARIVTEARRRYRVDRMAISGGEPTLNRAWLVHYFKELGRLNPDEKARLHLDSNGTILTPDYIDELILEGGMTDVGIEPKGLYPETFMRITGITDEKLAKRYLETSWKAIEYVIASYREKVFLGVGLPYNSELIGLDEVEGFGKRLCGLDPEVQLCVLDYFPTFRRKEIERPQPEEMFRVKRLLEGVGLKAVVVQTSLGHFGPEVSLF